MHMHQAKPRLYTRRVGALAICAALLGVAACAEPFAPYWRIDKTRVLALKSDPVTLKPGKTATIEALVHNPDNLDLEYSWEWCPFLTSAQDEYKCPVTRDELIELLSQGAEEGMDGMDETPPDFDIGAFIPEFDLGDEEQATLAYPILGPDFLLALCLGAQGALAGEDNELANQAAVSTCERGYEINVRVSIKVPGQDRPIVSAKRVNMWTGSMFDQNLNPDITDFAIRVQNTEDVSKVSELSWVAQAESNEDRWYAIPEGETLELLAGIPYEVRTIIDEETVELWRPPAPAGSEEERAPEEREVFVFRWMVSNGDLDDSRKLYAPELNELDDASTAMFNVTYIQDPTDEELATLESGQDEDWDLDGISNEDDNCRYLANEDQRDSDGDKIGDACEVKLWSIVRDGRLGIDWIERDVKIIGHAN